MMELIAMKDTPRRVGKDPDAAYGKALADHLRMETELLRAQNRWQKSRRQLAACEKRLDKAFNGAN